MHIWDSLKKIIAPKKMSRKKKTGFSISFFPHILARKLFLENEFFINLLRVEENNCIAKVCGFHGNGAKNM